MRANILLAVVACLVSVYGSNADSIICQYSLDILQSASESRTKVTYSWEDGVPDQFLLNNLNETASGIIATYQNIHILETNNVVYWQGGPSMHANESARACACTKLLAMNENLFLSEIDNPEVDAATRRKLGQTLGEDFAEQKANFEQIGKEMALINFGNRSICNDAVAEIRIALGHLDQVVQYQSLGV